MENFVSILIPFVKIDKFFIETLQSISTNDKFDSEVILVSNSSDYTLSEIQTLVNIFLKKNKVKSLIENKKGISYALNSGIAVASGKYIMRIDSDDILLPNRIEKQVEFLENNYQYVGVGGNVILIDEFGVEIGLKKMPMFNENSSIIRALSVENPFIHPSMMIRRDQLLKYLYSDKFIGCEDYHLWYRIVSDGYLLTNINTPVIKYRIHSKQSSRHHDKLVSNSIKLLMDLMSVNSEGYYWYRKRINDSVPTLRHYLLHVVRLFRSKSNFERINLLKQLLYK